LSKIGEKTLAIIAVHLFGLPENMAEIKEKAQSKQVIVIEDAAQGLGNRLNPDGYLTENKFGTEQPESMFGSMGDIGILSFGRGKPLSLLGGGAILVNNTDLYKRIKDKHDLLDNSDSFLSSVEYRTKLFLYSFFFHPSLYWIPANMPGLRIGETYFSLDFAIEKCSQQMIGIGNAIAATLNGIRQIRLRMAMDYRKALNRFRDELAFIPEYDEDDDNVALMRFPIIFKKKENRDRILLRLRAEGLGATGMYPAPLNEIQGTTPYLLRIEVFPEAKYISERILTLPLHEYVTVRDIEKIVRIFETE
jgi:dTDP-4-amino-4,6-dideoxygalactose transaminase